MGPTHPKWPRCQPSPIPPLALERTQGRSGPPLGAPPGARGVSVSQGYSDGLEGKRKTSKKKKSELGCWPPPPAIPIPSALPFQVCQPPFVRPRGCRSLRRAGAGPFETGKAAKELAGSRFPRGDTAPLPAKRPPPARPSFGRVLVLPSPPPALPVPGPRGRPGLLALASAPARATSPSSHGILSFSLGEGGIQMCQGHASQPCFESQNLGEPTP